MSAPTRQDWRFAYHERWRATARALREARARGDGRYVFGDGGLFDLDPCDPSRLTDSKIDALAREHGERVVQRAIRQEVERRRRLGQPMHGLVEEIS